MKVQNWLKVQKCENSTWMSWFSQWIPFRCWQGAAIIPTKSVEIMTSSKLVKNLSGKFLPNSTKQQKGRTRVWSSSGGNSKFENKRRFHYHKFKRRKPRNETKEAQEGTSSRDLNPNPNFNETWRWTRVNLVCLFACPLGFWGRTEGVWSRRRETGNHGKRRAAQEREREGWGSQCLMKCSTGWMCALHFGCV